MGNDDEILTAGKGVEGSTRTQIRNMAFCSLIRCMLLSKVQPRVLERHEIKQMWNRHETNWLLLVYVSVFCNPHLSGTSPVWELSHYGARTSSHLEAPFQLWGVSVYF